MIKPHHRGKLLAACVSLAAGCALHPEGEREERERAAAAGRAFEKPFVERELPALAPGASWRELLRRAFLSNAELEESYWAWRAALERIPQEASPKTTGALFLEHLIGGGSVTGWERTAISVGNDPMFNLPWPGKLSTAGRRALEEARAAGLRFEKAKFELQRKMISAYQDWAFLAEQIRLQEANAGLLATIREAAEGRTLAGQAPQHELLKARTQEELAVNRLESSRSMLAGERARLNALLGRGPGEPLDPPARLPDPRRLAYGEEELLRLAAERNPELLALVSEARSGEERIRLAKLEFIPELGLGAGTDLGGVAQTVGAMITFPLLRYEAIRAGIEEARAELERTHAMRRQAANDIAARAVLDFRGLRDAERQIALFEGSILPRAELVVTTTRTIYSSGAASLLDLLDSQRTLNDAREMLARLRTDREKLLAEVEALAAVDIERGGMERGGTETEPVPP